MVRSKNKRRFNFCYCVTLLLNQSPCGMYPWKNPQKSCIVIQNGRQNEVAVIMYVMVLISMGCKENKTCSGGKKRWHGKNLQQ